MARFAQGVSDTMTAITEITNRVSAVGQTMLSTPTHWRDGVESTRYVAAPKTARRPPRARNHLLISIASNVPSRASRGPRVHFSNCDAPADVT